MNSTGQNGEKQLQVILLLVVGLTAFSSAMKELNQTSAVCVGRQPSDCTLVRHDRSQTLKFRKRRRRSMVVKARELRNEAVRVRLLSFPG